MKEEERAIAESRESKSREIKNREGEGWEGEGRDFNRQEVTRRLRNLIWTVSGNYNLDLPIDTAAFRELPSSTLYDAVRRGAFSHFFDGAALDRYLRTKVLNGAEPTVLYPIALMCVDSAVWKKVSGERSGVPEIREDAFKETLEKDQMRLTHTNWGELEASYLRFCLTGELQAEWAQGYLDQICAIRDAETTKQVIDCVDQVYEEAYEKGFADWFKGLEQMTQAGGRDDDKDSEQGGEEEEQPVGLFTFETQEDEDGQKGDQGLVVIEDEAMQKVREYVEQSYGKSYLDPVRLKRLETRLCKGSHSGRHLHFTEGLLHEDRQKAEEIEESQADSFKYQFAWQVREENLRVYREHELVTRQNIRSLAEVLMRGLFVRQEPETFSSEYGAICINKLWNVGRTKNRKLFTRKYVQETDRFVVEVLIDSSGSQQPRQSRVALQAYTISEALSLAGIAHQVMGFCTFGDFTVLRRYRDYDDGPEANERIFEFYGSANNRDGLAVRAAAHSLFRRPEEHKILIVLSDGTPNDVVVAKSKFVKTKNGRIRPAAVKADTRAKTREDREEDKSREPYCGEFAVKDSAGEVYSQRNRGIAILGIFAGEEEALPAEREIFGNEFVYIRDITEFSKVVGRYLKERIMEQ